MSRLKIHSSHAQPLTGSKSFPNFRTLTTNVNLDFFARNPAAVQRLARICRTLFESLKVQRQKLSRAAASIGDRQ
jgi:hypothetical protein